MENQGLDRWAASKSKHYINSFIWQPGSEADLKFIVRGYGLYFTPAQLHRGLSMVDNESNRLFRTQLHNNGR